MYLEGILLRCLRGNREEKISYLIGAEDIRPGDTPIHDMVECAGEIGAKWAGHRDSSTPD